MVMLEKIIECGFFVIMVLLVMALIEHIIKGLIYSYLDIREGNKYEKI